MNLKKFLHQLKYIDWRREAEYKVLTQDQLAKKLKELKKNGNTVTTKTVRSCWNEGSFAVETRGYYQHLYIFENKKYTHYSTNTFDDSKNDADTRSSCEGTRCAQIENKLFEKLNGVSEHRAFGYCDRKKIYRCIPKQFYFINEKEKNKNIKNVSKVDFSSHYPSCMRGLMPDWSTHIEVTGTIKPNKEYPFAFYVKSGMCAEFKSFDMHDWLNSRFVFCLFGNRYKRIAENEDVTILCKASKYNFNELINFLYEKKMANEDIDGISAKKILNASIGFKHLSNIDSMRSRLDHLAAIVIGRANQKMLDICENLKENILQVIVDGIIFKGNLKIGEKDKYLGCLHLEQESCEFRMRGINQYLMLKNGECVCYCHSGFNANILTKKLEDIDGWKKEVV